MDLWSPFSVTEMIWLAVDQMHAPLLLDYQKECGVEQETTTCPFSICPTLSSSRVCFQAAQRLVRYLLAITVCFCKAMSFLRLESSQELVTGGDDSADF